MRRVAAVPILVLLLAAGCGDSGGQQEPKGPINVGQALKRAATGRTLPVTVQGAGYRIGKNELVLAGKQRSVFAIGPGKEVREVRERGKRVLAYGGMRRLSAEQAAQLDKRLARVRKQRSKKGGKVSEPILRAPRKPRDPYLDLQRVEPAPGGGGKGKQQP
jgi:hypothetical protein